MDQAVSINLSQLLFFLLTGLAGVVWKSLNDKFTTTAAETARRLEALDSSYRERLDTVRKDTEAMRRELDERSKERARTTDSRLQAFEVGFSKVAGQLADIDKDLKDLRLSLASRFATKEDLREAMAQKSDQLSRLEEQLSKITRKPVRS